MQVHADVPSAKPQISNAAANSKPRQITGPVERSIAPIDEGFGEAPQSFSQHALR